MTAEQERTATGGLVEIDGERWYRIDHVDRMEPFLMSVVSDVDLWMFVSSAGPLTAGRVDADRALLPYETDDRLHRAAGVTGPVTLLARDVHGVREVWRAFHGPAGAGCRRAIAKHELGNALRFEEHNDDWGLAVCTTWAPAPSYGWVRTTELIDAGGGAQTVDVLDGLLDVMPAGVPAVTEQHTSNLVDAYKRSETGRWGTAAVFSLESLITDRAEPAEALAATLVWASAPAGLTVHVDERVQRAWLDGSDRSTTRVLTGRRGSYLLEGSVAVPAAGSVSWQLVADTPLGHAEVTDRVALAGAGGARERVEADVRAGASRLRDLLAGADAFQTTGDAVADAHHLSNVMFNGMRGGVFPHGYDVPTDDLAAFLADRNADVHRRHAADPLLAAKHVRVDELHAWAAERDDPQLQRLVLEYLPLTFSRRHGDPSRPWNRFSIRVQNDDGEDLLAYEGNWRDIFQNWEALLCSYPWYFPHVVAKFVNASTLDGHNPYRISRDGIDWETPEPDDPWGHIGYWGDHQIVYLLRLLEGWRAADPGALPAWLARRLFTYADVPYDLADHEQMVADPRNTITFDTAGAARVDRRVERIGADGRLIVDSSGAIVHVTLAEKLLVPALAKLSCFVPGGGTWMNTQRPEWNDANNALAGYGLSMVTTYHLERYLVFLQDTLAAGTGDTLTLTEPVAAWVGAVASTLADATPGRGVEDPRQRRALLDALSRAGASYRAAVRSSIGATTTVDRSLVERLLADSVAHVQATIAAARRPDGLFHAYNLISFPGRDVAQVDHLPLMLEGQVAVLTSTALDNDGALALVDRLFSSELYRADVGTFVLYPPTRPPSFLDRNRIPDDVVASTPVLQQLVGRGASGILHEDVEGGLHFRPGLANAPALDRALDDAGLDPAARAAVHEVYERLFRHHAFTGRSSGMYGYEGIGSVYWHMVSKLLVGVQERYLDEVAGRGDPDVAAGLRAAYHRVRDGLGFRQGPADFGAVPTDCYSHTPAHAGAQQPGMTGQVKEQVLARFGDLGVHVIGGRLQLQAPLLDADQLLSQDGTASLTCCAVPVTLRAADRDEVVVTWSDGTADVAAGAALTVEQTQQVFARSGAVAGVEFRTTQVPS